MRGLPRSRRLLLRWQQRPTSRLAKRRGSDKVQPNRDQEDRELDGRSGQFYNGLRPSKANPQAYDDTARERLRVLSLQLTGLA